VAAEAATAPNSPSPNCAHVFATALFDELARSGVKHVCISPGSRSTPLTVAAARHPALRCWSHIDERSGAFFALGLAKATRAPVALVCTSGTAAANFHPAVIEAHYGCVPLIVLTADRPPELREWDAGQTIDQVRLYGPQVRWFAEAPTPDVAGPLPRYARALACRAVAEASGRPRGPVHLNLPFREPLEPAADPGDVSAGLAANDALAAEGRREGAYTRVTRGAAEPAPERVESLRELALAEERGVIACGPMDASADLSEALVQLASATGWPLLADAASQLRRGPHTAAGPVVATSDLFLRDQRFAATHAPAVVLRFGGAPTSKAFRLWIERHAPAQLLRVDPDGVWSDPSHLASESLRVDPLALCRRLSRDLPARSQEGTCGDWLSDFLEADRRTEQVLEGLTAADDALLEPRAVRELAEALPDGALLYVSNSMPVRDLDGFLPTSTRPLRVLCNRGANGIDGMVSSALGAAAAGCGPAVLLTGDLAFVHDLGGLLAARRHGLRAAIVVLNNDGGGIFHFLPISAYGEAVAFEEHFRTPHGLDLGPVAESFGAAFTRVASWQHYRASLKEALASTGLSVIEVPVSCEGNHAHHQALVRAVSEELADLSAGVEA
jgi:2-succinyl-5-enolpyruvyl-6-hydroxy-3-cyclohexene-1-carboxylate synthase